MADIVKRNEYGMGEWDPFRLMREMMRWDPFRGAGMMPRVEQDLWLPHFDVRENGNSIKIIADVPGVKREELEISVVGSRLVVTGRREHEERGKDEERQKAAHGHSRVGWRPINLAANSCKSCPSRT